MTDLTDLARKYYVAFQEKDRAFVEANLAEGFTFTSPYDDHIDRATYFERCWPNSQSIDGMRIESAAADGDAVLILYEVKTATGAVFRNVERLAFKDRKLASVEVYFGDPPGGVAREDYLAFIEAGRRAWEDKAAA
jgi:hypothetical protein